MLLYPSKDAYLRGSPQPLTLVVEDSVGDGFELYRRIARPGIPSFLLESGGTTAHRTARYSFLGDNPYAILTGTEQGTQLMENGRPSHFSEPSYDKLFALMEDSRIAAPSGLPPFYGGAVGYVSYDWVRTIEFLPSLAAADVDLPLLEFAFVDLVAALDHADHRLYLIYCPPLSRFRSEPREKLYREGCDRLAELEARFTRRIAALRPASDEALEFLPDQTRNAYTDRVRRCQHYIAAGDIYQANLSHRFTVKVPRGAAAPLRDLFPVVQYGRLRAVNPSPFSACLCFNDVALVCSSPERLVRLRGRRADTRPIAGTRPRGNTAEEDRRLLAELLANSKERAEHLMLVDLERNDLGRVCRYGSVRVDDFMTIEQYSHVSHLVSNVAGDLRSDVSGRDLIKAVFPGGTITGVPKIRCMHIIEELEPTRRGPYTGALGYLSWNGELDLNILIRTMVLTNDHGYVQVGAGIVADSDPDSEYDETLHKARAFFAALGRTG
ncbi:MAG TPA: anthranilate synthase component I family protein [Nitrospiraceae bacterium]|nr:anthranilate synthase component I family protein [Nitrospiraceae bacterium]